MAPASAPHPHGRGRARGAQDVGQLAGGPSGRVWEQPWPEADPALLARETFTLVVQVNGKLRDQIEAAVGASEQELLELATASDNVRRHIDGREIVKEIVVPGKLVNLVVR